MDKALSIILGLLSLGLIGISATGILQGNVLHEYSDGVHSYIMLSLMLAGLLGLIVSVILRRK
jgi:hypothetical protein